MLIFIEQNGGWVSTPPKMLEMIDRLKIHNYPELYKNKETLSKLLLLAFMPAEEINALGAKIQQMNEEEQALCTEELINSMSGASTAFFDSIPDTPEEEQAAQKAISELSPEEFTKAMQQAQITMSAFFATFFNLISMMVHGRRMTDLVQAAECGDEDAFFLAAQIDKRILSALPYFKERYDRAILNGETDFLDKLHYRLKSPLLRSNIRYKTLWLTLACLDESGYLDGSLKHREILDICDAAGVGGYKNRIEDVGYLSKRIREYREFQKINQRSRH